MTPRLGQVIDISGDHAQISCRKDRRSGAGHFAGDFFRGQVYATRDAGANGVTLKTGANAAIE